MSQQIAIVDAGASAELAHRVSEPRLDQRVDHDSRPPTCLLHGDVQVLGVLHPWMPDLLEGLIGKLRLEGEHEALRRLARRVGDDVQLDGNTVVGHPGQASAHRTVCS